MIKYRTGGFGVNLIETVDVERETEHSIWINGRRNSKKTSYHKYWDTWQEAHEHLLEHAERAWQIAQRKLARAESEYIEIKGMINE